MSRVCSDLLKGILPPWWVLWFLQNGIAVFILLAPAAGKTLSSGQRIRITGISPLRGSLRAVSGSTIIILAVIAYIGSCPMVCDRDSRSSLRYPMGWRIMAYLTSGCSPGLMSQCLHIQFSMFSRGLWESSLYLYQLGGPFFTPLWGCFWKIFRKICFLSVYANRKCHFQYP